jgi:hypothetical protein
MHAGMPVRRVEITGTRRDVYRQAYQNLEALQPMAVAGDAVSRANAIHDRLRVLDAELQHAGLHMDDTVHSWSLLLDVDAAAPYALANLTPETQAAIAAERIRLIAPTPGNIAIPISVDSYAGRVLRFMKTPGFIAPVTAIFAVLGYSNALDDERKALKGEQYRAIAMLVVAYAGLAASAFEVVKVSIEGAAKRNIPLLGPMAKQLSGRFVRFMSIGGAGAGAAGMWIAVGVDFVNARDAIQSDQPGMLALYITRLAFESALALNISWSLFTLIASGTAAELFGGPVAWIITGCIVVVSIIIDLTKDPETLKWARHCHFGREPEYKDDEMREQKDFASAIAAG